MHTEHIQLEDDEHIVIQVRKHWFILTMRLLGIVLVGMFPAIALYVVLHAVPIEYALPTIPVSEWIPYYIVWLIVCWMALFNVWTNYYLDVWTVTNKRLVSVDQRGLFNRYTGSFRLERLQDINVSIQGIIPTLLNYGSIEVETASGDRDFIAHNIPQPQELKALIFSNADALTFRQTPEARSTIEV